MHFEPWSFLGGVTFAMGYTYAAKVVGDKLRSRVRRSGLPWR